MFRTLTRTALRLARAKAACAAIAALVLVSMTPAVLLAQQWQRDSLVLGGGYAGVLRGRQVVVGTAELRFHQQFRGVHPAVILGATDTSRYVGVAALYNVDLTPRWRVTVSSGPGYYVNQDERTDLGCAIEFFSNAELSYRFFRGARVALSFGHISNAHLGKRNPGTETLRLALSIPIARAHDKPW